MMLVEQLLLGILIDKNEGSRITWALIFYKNRGQIFFKKVVKKI